MRPTDPDAPLALPKTEADDVAATLPESAGSHTGTTGPSDGFGRLEDEDMELQMALQASLGHDIPTLPADPPQLLRASVPLPPVDSYPSSTSGSEFHTPQQTTQPLSPVDSDPPDPNSVEATMAHSRRIYERMLAEQTQAHRQLAAEGVVNPRRRQEEEEEEEMIRRAIAESEAMARVEGHGRSGEGDDMDVDVAPSTRTFPAGHRVYDDEDEELQAALRASIEDTPENWTPPVEAPVSVPIFPHSVQPSSSSDPAEDDESIASEDTAPSSDHPTEPTVSVSVEEMRRRRLARFGG